MGDVMYSTTAADEVEAVLCSAMGIEQERATDLCQTLKEDSLLADAHDMGNQHANATSRQVHACSPDHGQAPHCNEGLPCAVPPDVFARIANLDPKWQEKLIELLE